jgi:hypothetical protein
MKRLNANYVMNQTTYKLRQLLSWYGLFAISLCLIAVLGHYFFSAFQPVRWPTKVYFLISFFLAVSSRKWSTFFVLFSLPLLPEFHIQAEHVFHPAVKYFVGYPGVDIIIGFALGQWVRLIFIEKENPRVAVASPTWPLGLLLLVLSVSVAVAIARNLWQTNTAFHLSDLFQETIKFKFLTRLDNYYPIVDFIVYGTCGLFIITLLYTLRKSEDKDDVVFKPIILGLLVSASLGIFQALTRFGLPPNTWSYRSENFGFAAQAFQPDLHAFAAHMLIGAIGLFGWIYYCNSNWKRNLSLLVCAICWIALILSKSRASFLLASLATALFVALMILKKPMTQLQRIGIVVVSLGSMIGFIFLTNNYQWIAQLISTLTTADLSNVAVLNELSRDRLDLHGAALRMGWSYPLFGIGQGNFFRLSSIVEFSGSAYMKGQGGENAHNYFFQTFAEVGLLGIACFSLVFLTPLLSIKPRTLIVPTSVAIASVFAGNIYSHSLIIRENLFLLSGFIALLLSYKTYRHHAACPDLQGTANETLLQLRFSALAGVLIFVLALVSIEIYSSFYKLPFILVK